MEGLIVLIIIASIVGNILKQTKNQGERGGRTNNPYSKPEKIYPPQNRSPQRKFTYEGTNKHEYGAEEHVSLRSMVNRNSDLDMQNHDMDRGFSLEGKRMDIGTTYESSEMPSNTPQRRTLESVGIGKSNRANYRESLGQDDREDVLIEEKNKNIGNNGGINLRFNEDSLINAIIMSEVIGPPKCKR